MYNSQDTPVWRSTKKFSHTYDVAYTPPPVVSLETKLLGIFSSREENEFDNWGLTSRKFLWYNVGMAKIENFSLSRTQTYNKKYTTQHGLMFDGSLVLTYVHKTHGLEVVNWRTARIQKSGTMPTTQRQERRR